MLRGCAVALLLLAAAVTAAAQQPAPPTAAQTTAQSPPQTPPDARHFVTVTFHYDFAQTPPCAGKKPKHPCVSEFAVFETTAGSTSKRRVFLFNVPLPQKPAGTLPITFQSPQQIDFVLGWHRLGVAALDTDRVESTLRFCDSCATWIYVQAGPTPAPSAPAPGSSKAPPTNN